MKFSLQKLLTLCAVTGVFAPSLNINENQSISSAQKSIAAALMSYYRSSSLGTIPEKTSEGPDGFQWFEMGFYWMAIMHYTDVGKDFKYFDTAASALANASFGASASFLGDPALEKFSAATGKWNDDILWWALAAVHGAELTSKEQKTPLGSTFFDIAKNTYVQVRDQWDGECGGGLYWARSRTDSQANKRLYKSTITNVEQIILAARLYKLTNDKAYLDHAIQVYNWLTGPSNLITADGKVYDGTYATVCNQIERAEHSYNPGLFLGGAALLFDATKDKKYMADIQRVMGNYEKVFVKDNIFIDPCETTQNCKQNQAQFKGVAIFSLNYVYKYATDDSVKNKVKTWIETSASAMANTCDDNWQCSNFWLPETTNRPRDVHNQMNALFMSNSLSQLKSVTVPGGQKKPSSSENSKKISIAVLSSIIAFVFLL